MKVVMGKRVTTHRLGPLSFSYKFTRVARRNFVSSIIQKAPSLLIPTTMKLHTILGANGTIAKELVPVLQANGESIRLVSRNPKPVPGAETRAADVLDYGQVVRAVEGSHVVYLLIGIPYDHKVWQRDWPVIMRNVIDACKATGARLVFFDDVYMYGKVDGVMTEETPYRPSSKKGWYGPGSPGCCKGKWPPARLRPSLPGPLTFTVLA
jgi:hypothetical protein